MSQMVIFLFIFWPKFELLDTLFVQFKSFLLYDIVDIIYLRKKFPTWFRKNLMKKYKVPSPKSSPSLNS